MTIRLHPAFLLSLTLATAALAAPAPSAEKTHPLASGTRAPDAALRTIDGQTTSLAALLGGKPTVVVFYRGGWCPFCNKHLAALGESWPEVRQLGFQIIALSPDASDAERAHAEKLHLGYQLVSDRSMAAADAFGVAFRVDAATVAKYREYKVDLPPMPDDPQARWLPVPAVFVIDADGVIRFAHSNPDYRVRLPMESLLATLHQLKN